MVELHPLIPELIFRTVDTPSDNKMIFLEVIQSKWPDEVKTLSAFTIPSSVFVPPPVTKLLIAFITEALPLLSVSPISIVALLLKLTTETLLSPVGLLAGKKKLFTKSIAASWA